MNARRGFLKTLGLAIGAAIFLPKAPDAFRWKRSGIYVPNPAWVSAPYEFVAYMGEFNFVYRLDNAENI